MTTNDLSEISTSFTRMLDLKYPIIGAPMFLVSNEEMVVETSNAGAIGTIPSLNFRPESEFRSSIKSIRSKTDKPIGVNIIVNSSNPRRKPDLEASLEAGVDLFITSLGSPKEVIELAHRQGAKVLCDVTNLEHAQKVQDMGADGVIAVCSGAGGHAGPLSPFSLIPWLKKELSIPVIAAGGIGNGATFAAAMALGADGVSVGTRFIASKEASVDSRYKEAILKSSPEDIVMTTKISGTPASVIATDYIKKSGTDLHWALKVLKNNPATKKLIVPIIHMMGMRSLEKSAQKASWKSVWSAGQTVGQIDDILSCKEIVEMMVSEFHKTLESLHKPQ